MQNTQLSAISNFIWGVADDFLRDTYVRGKYRDVLLPMTVLRRLDAVLEPTKQKGLDEKKWLEEAGIEDQAAVLEQAASQAFYNTSPFGLKDLTSRASQQQLRDDFNLYLDGFSPNVQDILEKFEFRNQVSRLSSGDILGGIVNRFLSPQINLSPEPVLNPDGSVRLTGLDNHAMGTIFEDLVRRFNEENNEEAGEHWTPRDAVELMAQLVFQPIRDRIDSGTYQQLQRPTGPPLGRFPAGQGNQVGFPLTVQPLPPAVQLLLAPQSPFQTLLHTAAAYPLHRRTANLEGPGNVFILHSPSLLRLVAQQQSLPP